MTDTPREHDGGSDPDQPVVLRRVANEFQAGLIVSTLEAAGIEARAFTNLTGATYVDPNFMEQAPVYVRRRDIERAEQALKARREESVDIAWSELNPGEPERSDLPFRIPFARSVFPAIASLIILSVLLISAVIVVGWLFRWWSSTP